MSKVGHYAGSKFCKGKKHSSKHRVDNVDDNQTTQTTDDNEGLYTVNQINKSQMPRCEVKIEGETIPFLIDTGACDNIIDLDAYKRLSKKVKLTQADKKLFAFGSSSK